MADALKNRLTDLQRKRAARTDRKGKPLPGYEKNIPVLDERIAQTQRKIEHGQSK